MPINRLGSVVTIYGSLVVDGALVDPISLRLDISAPSGSTTSYIYASDPEIQRLSVGQFSFDLTLSQRGTWTYNWFSNSSLTAFDGGTIEVANAVMVESVTNAVPAVALPFVTFRVWDEDGNLLDLELSPQRTDATGSITLELSNGTFRFAPFKLNWIFQPLIVDIATTTAVVQLVGRQIETRWLQWEDLESIVDVSTIDRLFNDKNTAIRDMMLIEQVIQQAETLAESQLLRSWTQQQIIDLASHDPALRAQAAWLALEAASERRQEFIAADGKGRYWAQYERSMAYFKDLSKSKSQSRGEETAGHGSNAGGSLRPVLRPRQARRIFADEPDGSGHGGF